jgi:hypothetical protein
MNTNGLDALPVTWQIPTFWFAAIAGKATATVRARAVTVRPIKAVLRCRSREITRTPLFACPRRMSRESSQGIGKRRDPPSDEGVAGT